MDKDKEQRRFNVGVVGLGHWGPNHVRVFSQLPDSRVTWACDMDPARGRLVSGGPSGVAFTTDLDQMLGDESLDAVVVSTPTSTHADICRRAFAAGKDVLCEKPLALRYRDALDLAKRAGAGRRVLMVGHVFLFHGAVRDLKRLIRRKSFGETRYIHAERTNLGPFRSDVGAILDLATHDVSICNWLLDSVPDEVNALGHASLQEGIEDYAFVTLHYPNGVLAHVHASWLHPRKVREITVVGSKQMIVFNDLGPYGPIALYKKSVVRQSYSDFGEFHLLAREGDLQFPMVKMTEPLKAQAAAFIEALRKRRASVSDARFSLGVMATLEAALLSMGRGGGSVKVKGGGR